MLKKIQETRYVITNEEENKYYKPGIYFTEMILDAKLFSSGEDAGYYKMRALTTFQEELFTKIIPIKITIERG